MLEQFHTLLADLKQQVRGLDSSVLWLGGFECAAWAAPAWAGVGGIFRVRSPQGTLVQLQWTCTCRRGKRCTLYFPFSAARLPRPCPTRPCPTLLPPPLLQIGDEEGAAEHRRAALQGRMAFTQASRGRGRGAQGGRGGGARGGKRTSSTGAATTRAGGRRH